MTDTELVEQSRELARHPHQWIAQFKNRNGFRLSTKMTKHLPGDLCVKAPKGGKLSTKYRYAVIWNFYRYGGSGNICLRDDGKIMVLEQPTNLTYIERIASGEQAKFTPLHLVDYAIIDHDIDWRPTETIPEDHY